MKRFLPVTEVARDDRFTWVPGGERFKDPRNGPQASGGYQPTGRMTKDDPAGP